MTDASGSNVISDDPALPGASDPTRFTVRSVPRLTVTKRVSNTATPGNVYAPNDRIAYDITVRNSGTENAANVVISDVIDPSLTAIDPGANGTVAGSTVTYTRTTLAALTSVAPGTSVSVRVLATIRRPLANGTIIANRASGTADTLTPVLSDDPDTAAVNDPTTITVTSSPRFVVTKSVLDVNGGSFLPGDQVRYTIRVLNTGGANATNLVVNDPVDTRLTSPVPTPGGTFGAGGIRWDSSNTPVLATLAVDASVDLFFTANIATPLDDGTVINNQARVTSDGVAVVISDDPNTPAANDPTALRVTSAADLSASTKEILNAAGMLSLIHI